MKKGIVIALMVVFSVFAVGVAFAAINADGTLLVDKPAAVFPAKKLNAGAKKKGPVTFNHKKHGEGAGGCADCHHTQKDLTAASAATIKAKSCFECHGPEAKTVDGKTQVDTYVMIHDKKVGQCIACHTADVAKNAASKAPTKCKACHGGADE